MTRGASVSRKEPLNFVITTAGYDRTSICWEMHNLALDIQEGRKIDGTFYPVVFSTPMEDDWTDPEVWKKCNPSLGVTVSMKNMVIECDAAKRDPALEMKFRRDFLCQWTTAETKWLPMDKYDKGAEPFDPMDLAGRLCYGGLDLASTNDIAAFVLLFPPIEDDPYYYILPYFWIPLEQMQERVKDHHVPYDKWHHQGFLNATEGRIIYYDFIEAEINKLGEIYDIRAVAFDEWGALQMAQNLMKQDYEMIKMRQGYQSLSMPSKEFMRLVLDEKVRHNGNPVLRWMFENVYIETDAAGNIKPTKKKSREKIDGVIGTIMALDVTIRKANTKSGGIVVYDYDTDIATRNGEVISAPEKPETAEERVRRIERETLFGYDL
jgi:phage terminase large subunit-like protein